MLKTSPDSGTTLDSKKLQPIETPQKSDDYSSIEAITQKVQASSVWLDSFREQMASVVIGQTTLIERLLIGLLSGGHILLEGLPGLAKTRAVKALAMAVQTPFQRIQFTPDMLPADIIGTEIIIPETPPSRSRKDRCSPPSFWPMKSTERRPRSSRPFSKPCRKSR